MEGRRLTTPNIVRPRVHIFIDYDAVIRHFLHSGAFAALEEVADVTYVFHRDDSAEKRGIHADVAALGLRRVAYIDVPRARMGAWERLYSPTVLHNQRGTRNWAARFELMETLRGKWRTRLLHWPLSLPLVYPVFKALMLRRLGIWGPVLRHLERERPDMVLHPSLLTGYFINELLPATRRLGIPFAVLINSWDNPSAKATCTGHPDRLAVWGEQTRQQAIDYLRMPPERVIAMGAAQFQVYRTPAVESEADLRRQFGVPEGCRLLLYAGSGAGGHETEYLLELERGVASGALGNAHVIYRPHPWRAGLVGGERDFFSLGLKHITMDPHMETFYRDRVAGRGGNTLFMADYRVTARLLQLVDVVVSPMSTLLLESLLNLKPAVILHPDDRYRGTFHLNSIHFRDFENLAGVTGCRSLAEVVPGCTRALDMRHDDGVLAAMRSQVSDIAVMDGPTYGERIATMVLEMTGAGSRWQAA